MHTLYYDRQGQGRPLLVLHGLFGSATNWRGVVKRLAASAQTVTVDLRNHGRSPHQAGMTYHDMADDLQALLDELGFSQADILAHSMGGKAAMVLALQQPDSVSRLVLVDIAPVTYRHTHAPLIAALRRVDLAALQSRAQADLILRREIPDDATRLFLLQNLVREQGTWRWRLNLGALARHMSEIMSFPDLGDARYPGPVLFVRGEHSDYITDEQGAAIARYFPTATVTTVAGAGHWVHADQPDRLVTLVRDFLAR